MIEKRKKKRQMSVRKGFELLTMRHICHVQPFGSWSSDMDLVCEWTAAAEGSRYEEAKRSASAKRVRNRGACRISN
jgi:hypothetical protein